jgi:hypothetical protein
MDILSLSQLVCELLKAFNSKRERIVLTRHLYVNIDKFYSIRELDLDMRRFVAFSLHLYTASLVTFYLWLIKLVTLVSYLVIRSFLMLI